MRPDTVPTSLMQRPRLRPHMASIPVRPDCVVLVSGQDGLVLRGRVYCELVPLLDGCRSISELVCALSDRVTPLEVWVALARLEGKGLLIEGAGRAPTPADAFWSALDLDPSVAATRLADVRVAIHTVGGAGADRLQAELSHLGIRASCVETPGAGEGALLVVVTDDYLRPELGRISAEALRDGRPWMLVEAGGAGTWAGPLFAPGQTGCWECLAARLRLHRVVVTSGAGQHIDLRPPASCLPSTIAVAAGLAATEVARWIATGQSGLVGAVLTMSWPSLEVRRHVLTRRPQCPACGSPPAALEAVPIELNSRPAVFTIDGGHRSTVPDSTVERLRHLVSPVTGIVAALVPGGHGDPHRAPLYVAFPASAAAEEAIGARSSLHHGTGKGKTAPQAQASAIAEAVERCSAVFTGETEVCAVRRMDELGGAAIPPSRILHFSEAQYAARDAWNAEGGHGPADWVPERFDESIAVSWTPVWSLTRQSFRYIPSALCYFNFPQDRGPVFGTADSNGNAAGNNLEEAILQGLMELVERDAAGIWWLNRVRRPDVDLESFDEPYLPDLRHFYAERGRRFWVLDVTNDLRIPSFIAVSVLDNEEMTGITLGFGAHLDARIGVLRAATECNQMTWWPGPRAGVASRGRERLREDWHRGARLADHLYLLASPVERSRTCHDFEFPRTDDLRDEILHTVRRLSERGLEVLVLDQTKPDLGLNAVKVFVPGLRHFRRRLGPGRLYEVPVCLDWLSEPLRETDMNPLPLPA